MNKQQALEAAKEILTQNKFENERFDKIDKALTSWTEQEAQERFGIKSGENAKRQIRLALESQALFLPLVLDVYSQSLKVDSFFDGEGNVANAWRFWKLNQMNAKQTSITRGALKYGTAYAIVTKGNSGAAAQPIISTHSPRDLTAFYGEQFSLPGIDGIPQEYPILAGMISGNIFRLYDEENIYYFGLETKKDARAVSREDFWKTDDLEFLDQQEHGIGVCPVIRFRDRWLLEGERQEGLIEPLISIQNRIDRTGYEQAIIQYFSAFKQRYIVGWNPENSSEVAKFEASAVWAVDEEPDKIKLGQFNESPLAPYLESRQASIRDLASIAQVPPQALGAAAISNISADGLAAMEASKDRKAAELKTSLGESYEQLLRLCAFVAGDKKGAADFNAAIAWADTSSRSFAATVDGLTKLSYSLDVPPAMLWEEVPGWNAEKIKRISEYKTKNPAVEQTEEF